MSEILSIDPHGKPVADRPTISLGDKGEALAAGFLVSQGYRLVISNFKVPVGRNSKGVQVTGEIDIIALDCETLCFIEVKTRRSDEFTPVITNVDARKQRQIIRTAKVYRKIFNIRDIAIRYDVVTVLMPKHAEPTVELIKGFWTEGKFRKQRWIDGMGPNMLIGGIADRNQLAFRHCYGRRVVRTDLVTGKDQNNTHKFTYIEGLDDPVFGHPATDAWKYRSERN